MTAIEQFPGPIWVAGGTGLVGSAVARRLERSSRAVIATDSRDWDLRDRVATEEFVRRTRPSAVIFCAARVGGIGANTRSPVAMLSDNVQIGTSVLDACATNRVPKVVTVASAAMYPAEAPQPIREESLWRGPAEPAHEAYGAAKLASVAHVRAIRNELGLPYVVLAPCNIYGIYDNFQVENSHVLPALMRKFWEARESGAGMVTVWGSGRQRREFIHADDVAAAVELTLLDFDGALPLNVGSGEETSISEIVEMVIDVVGYRGKVVWDATRPEGPAQRLLDSSRLRALGWAPSVSLPGGLASVRDWLSSALPSGQVRGWTQAHVGAR